MIITVKTLSTFNLNSSDNMINAEELGRFFSTNYSNLEELGLDDDTDEMEKVERAMEKYREVVLSTVNLMKDAESENDVCNWLKNLTNMLCHTRKIPRHGQAFCEALSDLMRTSGGLDLLMDSLNTNNKELRFTSARLLQEVLATTVDNKELVVERGLEGLMAIIRDYTESSKEKDVEESRMMTGILENLLDHSEETCREVVELGGLQTLLAECKSKDPETLRHCASALANVAIFGGSEIQEKMMEDSVPQWMFTLLYNQDITIKYFACLALAVLAANKTIETDLERTDSFKQIQPILAKFNPHDFSDCISMGKSKDWLRRLLAVLNSDRAESKILAAFHFALEAERRVKEGGRGVLEEIGAVEVLRAVATSPNGTASQYAAQSLRSLGEETHYKLSQQVTSWTKEDVKEWILQTGFSNFADVFLDNQVDGDLLLQVTEEMLLEDIDMKNAIIRKRFLRELDNLRINTDYSSIDPTGLNDFLRNIEPKFSVYTYSLLSTGIDKDTLLNSNNPFLPYEQHLIECGVDNKIHRVRILEEVEKIQQQGIGRREGGDEVDSVRSQEKNIDIFISYRRSNGAGLASLLKVHLEMRRFTVFLDVHGLEAGKFDQSLLQSIRSSRNFLLVCSPGALNRCLGDTKQKDWIHKEVACALNSECNIIPVLDSNFIMPKPDCLPESMRGITEWEGVRWRHSHQVSCTDSLDRDSDPDNF